MCLLIAINERFKSFRKPEKPVIALHTLNNVIYMFMIYLFYLFIFIC
jgi:hypothetical protein